ncbi:MAG: TetR/AcrR family transcriptional regulator [Clostridia bacterium]|nr:TetR/AcrR family transcriptional regulator [Clostridia bacterium]
MVDQNKRIDILKAASACFARYGYDKTTMDDIGKMVGLNKASLYYYYKNKDSIFTEVIALEADEFLRTVLDKVARAEGCKEKVITYIVEWLRYIQKAINLHNLTQEIIQNSCTMFNQLYEDIMEKETSHLAEILEHCIQRGVIVKCDSRKVAKSIITVTEAIKDRQCNLLSCSLNSEIDFGALEEEVVFTVSLMLNGLVKDNTGK